MLTLSPRCVGVAARTGLSIDVVRHFSQHKRLTTLMVYRDELDNKQRDLAAWVSEQLP